MAYPLGLTVKSLAGIAGAFSATTGGVLLFNIGGLGDFEVRVRDVIEDLGVSKSWCSKRGNKYVCDKKKNAENLKKIVFASRHNTVDKYSVEGNTDSVEIEIRDTGDFETFPRGVKFVIVKSTSGAMTIKKSTNNKSGWSQQQINIWTKEGELKVLDGKLMWVWEEINDLSKKVGLKCRDNDENSKSVSDCSFNEEETKAKLNVMVGKDKVEGATIDTGTNKLKFARNTASYFQGYKFNTQGVDIPLKVNGKEITDAKKIKQLDKNSSYQVIRDSRNETKWYLTKVGK